MRWIDEISKSVDSACDQIDEQTLLVILFICLILIIIGLAFIAITDMYPIYRVH